MNEKRDKVKHIAFTESEVKKIKNYAKHYNMTSSEFIRQAINDKILRIEKPESFNGLGNKDVEKILKNQELLLKEQKIMKTKLVMVNGLKNSYKSLSNLISDGTVKENFKLKMDKIKDVMKAYNKPFTPKELVSLTGFDFKTIELGLTQLMGKKEAKLNNNGRWVLNE